MKSGGTPIDPFATLTTSYDAGDGLRPLFNVVGAQIEVVNPRPLPGLVNEAIILTGQSTIANWGGGALYVSPNPDFSHMGNILNGRVYPARDPMFGADYPPPYPGTGTVGSSPGSALGDQRIALGTVQRVLVMNAAHGSTNSAQWASATGQLFKRFLVSWNFLLAHGWAPSQIKHIHQQGEADAFAGTPQATMLANLIAFDNNKRVVGVSCPMWISRTTFPYDWNTANPNPALWFPNANATAIRDAQLAAVNGTTRRQGFDTDTIRGYPGGRGIGAHWGNQTEIIAVAAGHAALLG